MLVRARRHGLSVYRGALPSGCLLSQAFYSTLYATGASARARQPSGSLTPKTIRPQLRVLQTCSLAKIPYLPQAAATSLNWSSTIHRIRHVSPAAMTTQTQTQTRSHAGHSHHHHHDNTFLLSRNKSDAGVRITRIGLYVNLGMAVSKGVGGYVFNSQGKHSRAHMGGVLLRSCSALRRCSSQSYRPRQRRAHSCDRGLVIEAALTALP